jgi:septation ring formation regulator EzrA
VATSNDQLRALLESSARANEQRHSDIVARLTLSEAKIQGLSEDVSSLRKRQDEHERGIRQSLDSSAELEGKVAVQFGNFASEQKAQGQRIERIEKETGEQTSRLNTIHEGVVRMEVDTKNLDKVRQSVTKMEANSALIKWLVMAIPVLIALLAAYQTLKGK